MSKKISSAWQDIDEETKTFCSKLSDIGKKKYKLKALMQKKLVHPEPNKTESYESEVKKQKKVILSTKTEVCMECNSPSRGLEGTKELLDDGSASGPDACLDLTESPKETSSPCPDLVLSHSSDSGQAKQGPSIPINLYACGLCTVEGTTKQQPKYPVVVDLTDDEILDIYKKV